MNDSFYKSVIEQSPVGYAYHKIIYDETGIPCDYEFIEVNAAFEKLTGLKSSDIVGRKVTEVLPDIKKSEFDWIHFYGDIALNGGEKEFEQFSEPLNKWYRVNVSSPEKEYFITHFIDISQEKGQLEELNGFIEVNLELLCIADTEGNFIKTNKAWKTILGYSTDELDKSKFLEFIHPDDMRETLDAMSTLGSGNDVLNFVNRYRCKDGSYRWIEWRFHPKGKLIYAAASDITERMQAQEALKKSETKQAKMVANIGDVIVIIDQNGINRYKSSNLEKVLGWRPEELVGLSTWENVHPDDLETTRKYFGAIMGVPNATGTTECRYRCKDGNYKWIEITVVNLLNDPDICGFLGNYRDINERKQMDAVLKENEERFKILTQTSMDGFWVVDIEGRFMEVNDAYCRMSGYSEDALLSMHITDLEADESAEQTIAHIENIKINGWDRFETRQRKADGTVLRVQISATFSAKNGFILCFLNDITKRKLEEEALKQSEERYRTIFEQAPLGIALVDSLTGHIYEVNQRFADITGKTIVELSTIDWMSITHPDDVQEYLDNMAFLNAGKINGFKMNKRYLHTDGSFMWVNMTIAPVKINNKEHLRHLCMIEDITSRKRLETALSNEKKLIETTLISVGDGVISTDNKGNIVFLNRVAEFLTGWTQEAAKGKSIEEVFNIVTEFAKGKSENIVKKVLESGKLLELDNHAILISKDGIELPIENSAAPIMQENGEIIGVVLVFRDFSEKKQRQAEIEFLSYHDQLTGLYNRRFYEEELKRLDTKRNLPLTLVMCDVNGLKLINDSFGHFMGDELLKKIAEVIIKGCRTDDIIARLGGDEFVILLPKTDAFEAEQIIKRITDLSSNEKVGSVDISISFGYGTKNNEEENIQEIFKKAEDYMYKKKLFEGPSMRGKTVGAIISTLHDKNKREEQHSHRVSALCKSMGEALGLSEYKIKELKTVGLLHDIGKIAIDEKLLNKPGKLTDDEWKEIKRHPEIGYRILSAVNQMSEMAEYVLAHHERWNGEGYPKGLKEEDIPLMSRIIAIADAYDAMTSERSYRSALSAEATIAELQKNAGLQFDPELVGVFIEKVLGKISGL